MTTQSLSHVEPLKPTKRRVRPGRLPAWIGVMAREPFYQFLLLGLLIWTGVEWWKTQDDRYIVRVGAAERQRIAVNYLQQFGQAPTPAQLKQLLDRYVDEEIFLREGLALNLDQDDEIVRRRIVQKYEFLQTDLAVTDTPAAAALQTWFGKNKNRYVTPERVAFRHVYFSVDRQGERAAKERGVQALAQLRAQRVLRSSELGDAFPGPPEVSPLDADEVVRLFGQSEVSQTLFKLPLNQWSGPYRSGYGWHLVYVTGHLPPLLPAFANVRDRVLQDYQDEQRRFANHRALDKVRMKYTVRFDGPDEPIVRATANVVSQAPPQD